MPLSGFLGLLVNSGNRGPDYCQCIPRQLSDGQDDRFTRMSFPQFPITIFNDPDRVLTFEVRWKGAFQQSRNR